MIAPTMFSRMVLLVIGGALMLLSATLSEAWSETFSVSISEEAGIPRHGEPVCVSLPFAQGALRAARFVTSATKGLYSMEDVLKK